MKLSTTNLIATFALICAACAGEPSTSPTSDASSKQAIQSTDASSEETSDVVGIPTAAECEAMTNETDCYAIGCTYFVEVSENHIDDGACSASEVRQRCLVTVSGDSERVGDAAAWYYRGEDANYEIFGVNDLGRVQGWTHYFDYPGNGLPPCADGP